MESKEPVVVAPSMAVLLISRGVAGCGEDPQAAPRPSTDPDAAAASAAAGEAPGEDSSPAPASATSPGSYGPIAFRQFTPETFENWPSRPLSP